MRVLASAFPTDPQLREIVALGAMNALDSFGRMGDLVRVDEWCDVLFGTSRLDDEEGPRVKVLIGTWNTILAYRRAGATERIDPLVDRAEGVFARRADVPSMPVWWARILGDTVASYVEAGAIDAAERRRDQLAQFARHWPLEHEIQETAQKYSAGWSDGFRRGDA